MTPESPESPGSLEPLVTPKGGMESGNECLYPTCIGRQISFTVHVKHCNTSSYLDSEELNNVSSGRFSTSGLCELGGVKSL